MLVVMIWLPHHQTDFYQNLFNVKHLLGVFAEPVQIRLTDFPRPPDPLQYAVLQGYEFRGRIDAGAEEGVLPQFLTGYED